MLNKTEIAITGITNKFRLDRSSSTSEQRTPGFLGIFDSCCGPLWLHLAGHKSYVVKVPHEGPSLVICIMSSDT